MPPLPDPDLDALVARLTHALRTPLSSIALSAATIARVATDDASRRAARRIETSSARLAAMLVQLTDYAHACADAAPVVERQPARADALCRAAIDALHVAHPDARVELRCDGDLQLNVDVARLAKALDALLANAVQHGTPGAPVELSADGRDARALRLRVASDGAIPSDVRARLFEPFCAPATGGTAAGLGLGLFLARHAVQALGGTLAAVAPTGDGAGTVFEIALPRDAAGP